MGFSVSQRKKLEYKKTRFDQLGKAINFLKDNDYGDNDLSKDWTKMSESTANWLNENLKEYKGSKNNIERFHVGLPLKVIYEKIVSEYDRYGWRVRSESFNKMHYDTKFASHCIRLLYEGEQLLLNGKLEFPLTGEVYSDIMSIKNCEVSIDNFYEMCNIYENRCRRARDKNLLRDEPDWNWANKWLVNVLQTAIKTGEI